MNLPTLLTLARLLLAPIGTAVLFWEALPGNILVAAGILLVCVVTDVVDGQLARAWGQVTTLGGLLDAVADKLVFLGYIVFLTFAGMYPLWLLEALIMREVVVNAFRSYLITQDDSVSVLISGKLKGALLFASLVAGLWGLAAKQGQLAGDPVTLGATATWLLVIGVAASLIIRPRTVAAHLRQLRS